MALNIDLDLRRLICFISFLNSCLKFNITQNTNLFFSSYALIVACILDICIPATHFAPLKSIPIHRDLICTEKEIKWCQNWTYPRPQIAFNKAICATSL